MPIKIALHWSRECILLIDRSVVEQVLLHFLPFALKHSHKAALETCSEDKLTHGERAGWWWEAEELCTWQKYSWSLGLCCVAAASECLEAGGRSEVTPGSNLGPQRYRGLLGTVAGLWQRVAGRARASWHWPYCWASPKLVFSTEVTCDAGWLWVK